MEKMETEKWETIFNKYEISNIGGIRKNGINLKPILQKNGYCHIGITIDGKRTQYRFHKLIAQTFIPNPEKKPCVNHKNGIKNDNRAENLEWCTYSENNKHSYKIGLTKVGKGECGRNATLTNEEVVFARNLYNTTKITQRQIWERHFKGRVAYSTVKKFFQNRSFVDIKINEEVVTNEEKPIQKIEYVKDCFDEYLSKKTHISASDIKNFMHSPRYYYYKKFEEVKEKNKETERHFPVGSAVHEVILEPELFKSNYVIAPKFDMRTIVGKTGYAEFCETSKGKTILFEDEFTMAIKMGESASQNDTFVDLIKDSYREVSCYTVDEKTGLPIRMRPDSFAKNKNTITDIKTCQESSPSKFKYDAKKYGYHISSAFYMDFLRRENYVFCAIEKTAPYETALYVLDDEQTEFGRKLYRMGLDLIKWSMDNNYWCSYNEFEILKECYELGNLEQFFEIKNASEKITILR